MSFSERQGIVKVNDTIQINGMDNILRNGLWNVFYKNFITPIMNDGAYNSINTIFGDIIELIWFEFFKEPIDSIPTYKHVCIEEIRKRFFRWNWNVVYDFLEFIVKHFSINIKEVLILELNYVLKRELSGYRVIGEVIVPISDEEQLKIIQKVLDNTSTGKLKGVNIHIKSALTLLSDKTAPDYRNSIKESISAIESLSQIISGNPNATLGSALNALKSKIKIHPALEKGFSQLYGYTSESDGIRHALLEEHNLDQEDAIYMLTSCSSFIHYLIIKANKAKIKLN